MAWLSSKKNLQHEMETSTVIAVHHSKFNWQHWLIVSLFAVVCVAVVSFVLLWQFDDNVLAHQQSGEVALADLIAPKSQSYQSAVKTKQLGDEAASRPENNVYKLDDSIVTKQRSGLENLLLYLGNARTMGQSASMLQTNASVVATDLTIQQLASLLTLPDATWQQIGQEARTAFSIEMSRDILPGQETYTLNNLHDAVYIPYTVSASFGKLDQPSRELTVALVKPFIKANNALDQAATQKKQDEARLAAGTATVDIIKGTVLIRRGDILTDLQIEELEELGLRDTSYNWNLISGTVGVVSILVLLLIFYCNTLAQQVWSNLRWPAFLTLCMAVAALAMRVLLVGADKDSTRPYLLPLAAVAMVIAALFDVNLALFFSALLALLVGLTGSSTELVIVFFAGSAASALAIRKAESTIVFAWAGLIVAVSQFAAAIFGVWLSQGFGFANFGLLLVYSLLNGLISASLAFFCFSVLGKLFGVATVLQLLELAHPNQPLLRRLIREAPGTYHHSILVSNLAEQAAERVSDNALLARVGAYYHDIGKLSRPTYYIDNQANGVNIHDELDPRESAKFIRMHVSDGVALARKHKLPRKVVDIIHQHHGTCMISFFYQKALKEGLDVNEIDFRYPGPKPQTKVAAIVMLADGCEAAVRANVQSGRILTGTAASIPAAPSPDSPTAKHLTIREVVDKIIDDRIRENQLSECDLTLRDVDDIRNLFVELLTGIYHPRLVYPDKDIPVKTVELSQVVTTVAREVPAALSTVVTPEPAELAVTAGAADSGGATSADLLLPSEEDHRAGDKGAGPFKSGKSRIGGAGRQVTRPGQPDEPRQN